MLRKYKMNSQLFIITFLLQFVFVLLINQKNSSNTKILSRKKRYLIFPEGSSFQLVYCLTLPTYGMGSIFTIGLTAALAWELPHEPIHLKNSKTDESEKQTDKEEKNVNNTQFNPWNQWGANFPQHHYITYDSLSNGQTNIGNDWDENWDHLPAYRNEKLYRRHGVVHRRTRRDLFMKIEKFFEAQNKDGRACLLKALCEVNQTSNSEKGTFIQEILRAVFTWIPADESEAEHEMFDDAAMHKGNCTEKFPTCTQSVWNPFF